MEGMDIMESIINAALSYAKKGLDIEGELDDVHEYKPRIKVIGCGGAGNNTIRRLFEMGIEGAETIAINTDHQHLRITQADKKILVGKSITRGLGTGGDPEKGRRAAENSREKLRPHIEGADLVFITAGMGGGTGTGVAPVVAEIAKETGAIVISMVSTPFLTERARSAKAEKGIRELKKVSQTVIILDNQRLLDIVPHLPIEQAFLVMDQIIAETIKGITETITQPSLINLDYADVKSVMGGSKGQGKTATILVGEASGPEKANDVVRYAVNNQLLNTTFHGATGALIHITGGPDLTLEEANLIGRSLTSEISDDANVIWGARVRDDYEGKVRVLAIISGIKDYDGYEEEGKEEKKKSELIKSTLIDFL